MNRRQFLRGLIGAAGMAAVPASIIDPFLSGETDVIKHEGIIIDYATKTIKLVEGNPSGVTMLDLWKFLKKEWEKEDKEQTMFPIRSVERVSGWRTDKDARKIIRLGGWEYGNS